VAVERDVGELPERRHRVARQRDDLGSRAPYGLEQAEDLARLAAV
jgi:hypothetical protein